MLALVNKGRHDDDEFNATLRSALDNALLALGGIVREAIYENLETRFQVRREEILEKPQAFHEGLQQLLGRGSAVIERQAMKNLYSRLGLDFAEHNSWTLVEYVNNAMKRFA